MLNVGGAITSTTNEMRSHSFNAHKCECAKSQIRMLQATEEIDFERIFGSVSVCYYSSASTERGREWERANKSILQSQISNANELNSIHSNGESRIEN